MTDRSCATRRTILTAFGLVGLWAGVPVRAADATRVEAVSVPGATHFGEADLRRLTGVRPGDPVDTKAHEAGRQALLRAYLDAGRYFASVELGEGSRPTDTRVEYRVVEGPRVTVGEVQFRGNRVAAAAALLGAKRGLGVSAGAVFRESAAAEDAAAVAGFYRGLGRAAPRVTTEVRRAADPTRVDVVYHITELTN